VQRIRDLAGWRRPRASSSRTGLGRVRRLRDRRRNQSDARYLHNPRRRDRARQEPGRCLVGVDGRPGRKQQASRSILERDGLGAARRLCRRPRSKPLPQPGLRFLVALCGRRSDGKADCRHIRVRYRAAARGDLPLEIRRLILEGARWFGKRSGNQQQRIPDPIHPSGARTGFPGQSLGRMDRPRAGSVSSQVTRYSPPASIRGTQSLRGPSVAGASSVSE